MTSEELKVLLSTPLALFVLMLFGTAMSMLKQYVDAKLNSSTITFGAYILKVETVLAIGANILAFGALIMTDTLNWTGALGIGYALNSVADLRPGGRSAEIIEKIPDPQ
jgi:hypothetical protein